MGGVFISYSRKDTKLASQIRNGLTTLGIEVIWDRSMPGTQWQRYLERNIKDLPAVLVLWTASSSESESVRDEARLGKKHEKLLNVLFELNEPPWPYESHNGLPLDNWQPGRSHDGWRRIIESLEPALLEAGTLSQAGELQERLKQQLAKRKALSASIKQTDAEITTLSAELEQAEAKFGTSQTAVEQAERQIEALVAVKAGPQLMLTAATERDAAIAGRDGQQTRIGDLREHLDQAKRQNGEANDELRLLEQSLVATQVFDNEAVHSQASTPSDRQASGDISERNNKAPAPVSEAIEPENQDLEQSEYAPSSGNKKLVIGAVAIAGFALIGVLGNRGSEETGQSHSENAPASQENLPPPPPPVAAALRDGTVSRSGLFVAATTFDPSAQDAPPFPWRELARGDTLTILEAAEDLAGTHRGSPNSTRAITMPLRFYRDDVRLIALKDPNWDKAGATEFYLQVVDGSHSDFGKLIRLNGTSPPIHEINRSFLKLTSENANDYLRFFGFFVRGVEGPFYILESAEDELVARADATTQTAYRQHARPIQPLATDDGAVDTLSKVRAVVTYSDALFVAEFKIMPSGMVEMLNDKPLASNLSSKPNAPVN